VTEGAGVEVTSGAGATVGAGAAHPEINPTTKKTNNIDLILYDISASFEN
jgi:hypothetical protein